MPRVKRCRRMPSIGVSFRDSATSAAKRAFSRLRASTSLLRAVTDRGSGPGLRLGTSSPRSRAR